VQEKRTRIDFGQGLGHDGHDQRATHVVGRPSARLDVHNLQLDLRRHRGLCLPHPAGPA
jgi:hypothetical protein